MPTSPDARRSRVGLHRGDDASWGEGDRILRFSAGLGVRPPEVYLPTEAIWRATAPAWARELREEVVRDFEAAGVKVVVLANAWVMG